MTGGKLEDVLPLAPGQAGLLYHALLDAEGADVYLVQLRFRVQEPVRVDALHAAVDGLLARHPSLRACFRHKGLDQPVQLVLRRAAAGWSEVDLSAQSPAAAEADLRRLLDADRARRFDVTRPPLVRATLVRLPAGSSELVLAVHHLVLDGWSMPILARDLADLYAGFTPPPAAPYRGYSAWLAAQSAADARAAWRAALAGLAEPTQLAPGADLRIGVLPAQREIQLPAELFDALRRRARDSAVTVNTLVQVAWALTLGRMTGSADLTFGAVASGRPDQLDGAETMVGMFVTTLPVRVRVRAGESVDELLRRIQREQADLAEHHHIALAQIQQDTIGRDLFDTVLAFENYPRSGLAGGRAGAPELFDVRDATHYPVSVAVLAEEQFWLRLSYRPDCVTDSAADLLAACLVRAFELLAADPAAIAADLDALPAAERDRVLGLGIGAQSSAQECSVPESFAEQVARTPEAVAVECCRTDSSLTYAHLDHAADLLAERLAAVGVGGGDGQEATVAVLLGRSVGLVVAELGVLKAGGCYVPLDPAQPEARLTELLHHAGAGIVVTDHDPAWLPDHIRTLKIDAGDAPASPHSRPAPHPDAAAYVMYTSGSTGTPKGVVVTHRNILTLAADRRFAAGAQSRVLLHSPHTFDATNFEMWVPLLTGGTVVLAGPEPLEPAVLRDLVAERAITAVWLTAELLRTVADLVPEAVSGVREVWAGGDVLSPEAVAAIQSAGPEVVVVNGYGPTETTTFATGHRMEKPAPSPAIPGAAADAALPIGTPLDDTVIRVLDHRLRPVPTGVTGEIYLGGARLARGYLGRPGGTAERFVADPFGPPGTRLFRVGDLGRWAPDGALEFLGRADDQVKIRGHRIEPAEVEALLEGCPAVGRALVQAETDPSGGRRLVAHLALRTGGVEQVRQYAEEHLPGHLRPSAYHEIDAVPLTPHGKVDRRALPERRLPAPAPAPARAAGSVREHVLCELFASALGLPEVGPDQNFFALGGHSLLAMRLVAAIEAESGRRLPVGILMDAPTPAALARRLESPTDGLALAPLLKLRAAGDHTPLFLLHSGSGLTWRYATLLPHIAPGRPIYGIQTPTYTQADPTPLPEDLGQLAEQYLARIRAVQPEGPYLLLGWSFGGLLAYDLAARLTRAGQQVALLAVVDSIPGDTPDEVPDADLVDQAALKVVAAYAADPPATVAQGARLDRDTVIAAVQAGGWCRDWSTARLETMAEYCAGTIRLVNSYRPPRFDGSMLLFCATQDPDTPDSATKAAIWRRTAAQVVVHELDCAHSQSMNPGPAEAIAAVLAPFLDDRGREN
ncbi:MAG TPA: amino acid adenylation domain-containing protein [Actinocrinis sp.]|nr:amino acid adenylation domain-containing protein [Actinocrinis sp.]